MRKSWLLTAILIGAAPASANDSTAEMGAGGLVLTRSDAIDMVSEDLFVSADQVRVRYIFRNRGPADLRTTVAFPLPDRDLGSEEFGDVAFPADFVTRVDGAKVTMRVERKAMLKGRDMTATLATLRIPVGGEGIVQALEALPAAEQRRLERMGLTGVNEYDAGKGMERHPYPLWTLRESWYWDQVFPAGRDLRVEHGYTPGTGGSVGTGLTEPEYRRSPEGRKEMARYCVDAAFLAGVDRMKRAAPQGYPTVPEQRVSYVLTTGANWRSPIGDFRLVVDKGSADNIVSFCGEGIRKISPTQFEVRRKNWRPDKDLHILILRPATMAG